MGSNYYEAVDLEDNEPPPPAASEPEPARKMAKQLPQRGVDLFWEKVVVLTSRWSCIKLIRTVHNEKSRKSAQYPPIRYICQDQSLQGHQGPR